MKKKNAVANFAQMISSTSLTPIALDNTAALVCMTVGLNRLKLFNSIYERISNWFCLDDSSQEPVYRLEAEAIAGEYGSGKSHISYMIKNSLLSQDIELLLAHCQITSAAANYQDILCEILCNLRISSAPSQVESGVEISAYINLFGWYGGNYDLFLNSIRRSVGNIDSAIITDFAYSLSMLAQDTSNVIYLQKCLDSWVRNSDPQKATEVFFLILSLFQKVSVQRFALVIDEFEAISHLPDLKKREILQHFQNLYDKLTQQAAGPMSCYMLLFTTEDWLNQLDMILPSLGRRNRIRRWSPIPDLTEADIRALVYKNATYYIMANPSAPEITDKDLDMISEKIISQSVGTRYHLRSIQRDINDLIEMTVRRKK